MSCAPATVSQKNRQDRSVQVWLFLFFTSTRIFVKRITQNVGPLCIHDIYKRIYILLLDLG